MKVILYFPPLVVASVKSPYPSLSILSSYLKGNSKHEVLVKDINVDFINKLIEISENNIIDSKTEPYFIKYYNILRNKLSLLYSLISSRRIYNFLSVRILRLHYRPF